MSRNVSWEVQKAIAILTMTSAVTDLRMEVVQAANFAGNLTGQIVRRWASALFVTLAEYPGDVGDSFIELELSSEHRKACGNRAPIIHDEEFGLAARIYPIKCIQEG